VRGMGNGELGPAETRGRRLTGLPLFSRSRVNRLSVLGAITSVQHRLKLYTKVPPNGLVVYCGTVVTDEGKEKKVNIDFEPFKPINTSLYLCDNKFHTEALTALLADDNRFGFIVMDGNGALFGTLHGNTREVLHKFSVDLPKKHGRGGQVREIDRPRETYVIHLLWALLRLVGAPICATSHGEASQLRAEGGRDGGHPLHSERKAKRVR
jgi:peptide subunit release factor 1 (eRF1)